VIDGASNYSIPYRFLVPGVREVRVAFRGDVRNIASVSDPVSVTIQQAENPLFTINTSAPIINDGQSATVSGVLSQPGPTPASSPTPQAGVWVTLWRHRDDQRARPVASTVTGQDGSYSFVVHPAHNVVYQVLTTFVPPARQMTALLFEGVRSVVQLAADTTTGMTGQVVVFRGAVAPDKAEHVIYLQQRGADGDFRIVAVGHVNDSSAYEFDWTLQGAGTEVFRTLVPGGDANATGASAPVAISVTLPPPTSLPPAS
jgi:hypothetical protein